MQRVRAHAYDWIVWALFLALPIVIFWQSATSLEEQGVASGGPLSNAAQFPKMLAWLLLGLAALNALRLLTGRATQSSPFQPTETTRLALIAAVVFIGYLLILPYLGYHLATPVLLAILLKLFGLAPLPSLAGGAVMSLAVAAVFQGLLNVVLPVGIYEITIFG